MRGEVQQLAATWSNAMEEQGSSCLPRVVRSLKSIESLRGESEFLSELAAQLSTRVDHLEMESSRSLKTLSELEVIKRRMDDCSAIFLQADRFRILVRNMDPIYESGDVTRMSEALAELVASYSHLSSLSEFEGDKVLVSRYTEKLESIVKPTLTDAIEKHDTQRATACIKTFRQINRSDQISLIFQKHVNHKVLALWQSFDSITPTQSTSQQTRAKPNVEVGSSASSTPSDLASSATSTSSAPITSWIAPFFEKLGPIVQHEVEWIPSILSAPDTFIAQLLISALNQLSTMLDAHFRKLDIAQFVNMYAATKAFASGIQHLIVPLGTGLRFQIYSALFAPFRKYQSQFHTLESKWIAAKLTSAGESSGRKNDPSDLISSISTHTITVFETLETSIDHCALFTDASEAEALEKLITAQLLLVMNSSSQRLQQLQPLLTSPSSPVSTSSTQHGTRPGTPLASVPLAAPSTSIVLSNTEWREDLFQYSVATFKIAVEMKSALGRLERNFREKVLAQKAVLFGDQLLPSIYQQNSAVTPNLFLYQAPEAVRNLAHLMDRLQDPTYVLFDTTTKMLDAFLSTVQYIMFETMFGFIRQQMRGFAKSANFARESTNASPAPQGYVKQIVEHFLVLPQVMEHIENEAEEQSQDGEVPFLSMPVNPFAVLGRPTYPVISSSMVQNNPAEAPGGFSVDWMVLVARETQLLLASHILQLPHLTSFGVLQLESDVSHLFSVLSVLELKQEEVLEQILHYCRVPASQFATLLTETIDALHKKMLIMIGRSRRVLPSAPPSK